MSDEMIETLKFIGVPTLILAVYKAIAAFVKKVRGKNNSLEDGVRAILRDRIVQAYNHNVHDRGYCPIYEKENVTDMYDQYHNLGGNGTITKLYKEMMDLPTQPKEDK